MLGVSGAHRTAADRDEEIGYSSARRRAGERLEVLARLEAADEQDVRTVDPVAPPDVLHLRR
jgi:hypothetical protein